MGDANAAIESDSSWAKGYYRKALAEIGLNKYDDAKTSLEKILELDAKNGAAKKELEGLPAKIEQWKQSEAIRKKKRRRKSSCSSSK